MVIRTITSALILLFSTVSLAGDMTKETMTHSERVQKDFLALDQDGNGLLNKSEIDANPVLAGTFVEIDLNDNNDIDMDEFIIYRSEATAAGKQEKDRVKNTVKMY
jgi:Ca2+-binding EF-hand superfamily protein